ncbi:MAG: lysophospholipase [Acidimicrobiia bacterium]|nr:lysophospholipase [Acidimicrobiia bacterium]
MNERSLPSRIWRGFLVVLAVAVLAAHVLGGWYFSGEIVDRVFTPPAAASEIPDSWMFATPQEAGLDVTEIQYDSPIGPMDAWVVDGTRSEWIIHVHGRAAGREEALRAMVFLDEAGYHQMAITYRNDPGQPVDASGEYRYGVTERDDLAAAVEYAREQGATDIVLYGYSTGAAISMAYAIRQPIGSVSAMIFDAPNIDLEETVDFEASQEELAGLPLPFTVTATAKFFAALRSDINWRTFDYVDRSAALSMPVLVFHGTEDLTVPLETSRQLAEARSDLVRFEVVEGAGHVQSYNADPASYRLQVLDFLAG